MFSPLTTRTISTPHQSGRLAGSRIDSVILHHAASANLEGTLATVAGTARQVSYNYVIGRAGEIVGAVSEQNRSWSVANAAWDSRAITICHVNDRVGDPWPVSAATHEASARLVADLHTRHGIPLNRSRIVGDRQIRATACPGGLDMDAIVNRAAQIVSGSSSPSHPTEDNVALSIAVNRPGRPAFQWWPGGVKHLATASQMRSALFLTRLDVFNESDDEEFQNTIWNYGLEEYSVDEVLELAINRNPDGSIRDHNRGGMLIASWADVRRLAAAR